MAVILIIKLKFWLVMFSVLECAGRGQIVPCLYYTTCVLDTSWVAAVFLLLHLASVLFKVRHKPWLARSLIFCGFSESSQVSKHCLMDASVCVFMKIDSSNGPCYLLLCLLLLKDDCRVSGLVSGFPSLQCQCLGFLPAFVSNATLIKFS